MLSLAVSGCFGPKEPPATVVFEKPQIAIVRDRPGMARLEGIGPIVGFARGRDSTFIHCLELALDGLGRKIGYVELMGLSGLAFRTQFRADRWDSGNADPLVGEDCVGPVMTAVGLGFEVRVVRREDLTEAEAFRDAVAASIDKGLPVLAVNVIPPEDWGLIVGYQREGQTWLCRSYHGGAEALDRPASGWPSAAVFITGRLARPDVKQEHAKSIRRAIELFEKRYNGRHAQGSNAFDLWRQSLESASDRRYLHANAWTYVSLIDARRTAAPYLRMVAREFGSKGGQLLKAADLYEQEYRLLLSGQTDVPSDDDFPMTIPPAAVRKRQAETLSQASELEKQAVEALRNAL